MKTKIIMIILFLGMFSSSNAQTGEIVTIKVIPKEINQILFQSKVCNITIVGTYNNANIICDMDSLIKKEPKDVEKYIIYIQGKIVKNSPLELQGIWKKGVFEVIKISINQ